MTVTCVLLTLWLPAPFYADVYALKPKAVTQLERKIESVDPMRACSVVNVEQGKGKNIRVKFKYQLEEAA